MSTIHDLFANVVKKDSLATHDWADADKWQNCPEGGWSTNKDSSYTIQPEPGYAIIIQEARVRYSRNAVMHSPLVIGYYMGDTKVGETVYRDQDDFFDRFDKFEVFHVENGSEIPVNIWSHEYEFDEPLVLWSSTGTDDTGAPKLNKMIIKIEDDEPFKDTDGNQVGLARVRYLKCLVCKDPDYVAPSE